MFYENYNSISNKINKLKIWIENKRLIITNNLNLVVVYVKRISEI